MSAGGDDPSAVWQGVFFSAAALTILFQIWRGWRAGVVRQLLSLAAIALAYLAAYVGGTMAAPIFRWVGFPDFLTQLIAGGVVGSMVFIAITVTSALLFKKTSEQRVGLVRFGYGLGGSALGAMFGLAIVLIAILTIRLLGSLADSRENSGHKQRDPVAQQPIVLANLGRLKRSLEHGRAGEVIEEIDPVPATVYSVLAKVGRALSTPERAARFLEFRGARALAGHPAIAALRDDPAIRKHLRQRNYLPLLRNERLVAAANDPEVVLLLRDFDLEKALDYALAAPEKQSALPTRR